MSASKKPAAGATRRIDPNEYDFSKVPNNELEACMTYEYMRESNRLRKAAAILQPQFQAGIPKLKHRGDKFRLTFTGNRATWHFVYYEMGLILQLAQIEGYPETPWQGLSENFRKAYSKFPSKVRRHFNQAIQKKFPMLKIECSTANHSLESTTLLEWLRTNQKLSTPPELRDRLQVGFFLCNMIYSKEAILAAFTEWLDANHPRKTPIENRGRKGSYRDALNKLGALRLRRKCQTLKEAQNLISSLEVKGNGMHYGERKAWNRAADSAVEIFNKLVKPLPAELPINFSKGWGGGEITEIAESLCWSNWRGSRHQIVRALNTSSMRCRHASCPSHPRLVETGGKLTPDSQTLKWPGWRKFSTYLCHARKKILFYAICPSGKSRSITAPLCVNCTPIIKSRETRPGFAPNEKSLRS